LDPLTAEYKRVRMNTEIMLDHGSFSTRFRCASTHGRSMGGSTSRARRCDGIPGPRFANITMGWDRRRSMKRFWAYLGAAGACICESLNADGGVFHTCDRDERAARFRASRKLAHPTRLKRALRSLRRLSPAGFDIVFPILARGQSFDEVCERVNEGRVTRGQEPYSRGDAEGPSRGRSRPPARPVLMGKKKKHRFVGFDPAVGSDGNVTVTATADKDGTIRIAMPKSMPLGGGSVIPKSITWPGSVSWSKPACPFPYGTIIKSKLAGYDERHMVIGLRKANRYSDEMVVESIAITNPEPVFVLHRLDNFTDLWEED